MKHVTYRGVWAELPDNVSISSFKEIVNICGKDNHTIIQDIINLLSRKLYTVNKNLNYATRSSNDISSSKS